LQNKSYTWINLCGCWGVCRR